MTTKNWRVLPDYSPKMRITVILWSDHISRPYFWSFSYRIFITLVKSSLHSILIKSEIELLTHLSKASLNHQIFFGITIIHLAIPLNFRVFKFQYGSLGMLKEISIIKCVKIWVWIYWARTVIRNAKSTIENCPLNLSIPNETTYLPGL